jgi:VanZ family protein
LHPELSILNICIHLAGWSAFAKVVSNHAERIIKTRYLGLSMAAAICGQVLIEERSIILAQVLGSIGALFLWALIRRRRSLARILFMLLVLLITYRGLAPFELNQAGPQDFHWLPLFGFMAGSRLINVLMIFQKTFLYGCVIWFLEQAGASIKMASLFCLVWISLIEVAQLWFTGHTPEITDVLIVIFLSLGPRIYRHKIPTPGTYTGPERRGSIT